MTRNKIIEKLFTGKNFNDCLSKMEPAHLREDLKQEVILSICELTDEQFFQIKNLEHYTVRIMINAVSNKYHPFYKAFRNRFEAYSEVEWEPSENNNTGIVKRHNDWIVNLLSKKAESSEGNIEERKLREEMEDMIMKGIDSLYWYDAEIVKLYIQHGSFRAIETATGIPWESCYVTVKKAMKILKEKAMAVEPSPIFSKQETKLIQA